MRPIGHKNRVRLDQVPSTQVFCRLWIRVEYLKENGGKMSTRQIDLLPMSEGGSYLIGVVQYLPGLGFMAVVDFATSDFETCPKYQNWANFINKSTTES